jgi:hypothetical protein
MNQKEEKLPDDLIKWAEEGAKKESKNRLSEYSNTNTDASLYCICCGMLPGVKKGKSPPWGFPYPCEHITDEKSYLIAKRYGRMGRLRFATLDRLAGLDRSELPRKDYKKYKKLVKTKRDADVLTNIWADRAEWYHGSGHIPWFHRGAVYNRIVERFGLKARY